MFSRKSCSIPFIPAALVTLWLLSAVADAQSDRGSNFNELVAQTNQAMKAGQFDLAERLVEQQIEAAEREYGRRDVGYAMALVNRVMVCVKTGKNEQAIQFGEQAWPVVEANVGADHDQAAVLLHQMAMAHNNLSLHTAAENELRRALAIREHSKGTDSVEAASVLCTLAYTHQTLYRYSEAQAEIRRAMSIFGRHLDKYSMDFALCLESLGLTLERQGRYLHAEYYVKWALKVRQGIFGQESEPVAASLHMLGRLRLVQGRSEEAIKYLLQALELKRRVRGVRPASLASTLNLLGASYRSSRTEEAEKLWLEAEAILEHVNPHSQTLSEIRLRRGCMYFNLGRIDEADDVLTQNLKFWEQFHGDDNVGAGSIHANLARLRAMQNRVDESERHYERAEAIYKQRGPNAVFWSELYLERAQTRAKASQWPQAIEDLRRSILYTEEIRAAFSGNEADRAASFEGFSGPYWLQTWCEFRAGNLAAAMAVAEQGRARSLMDQMAASHVDMLAGVPDAEARKLREAKVLAEQQLAEVQRQLQALPASSAGGNNPQGKALLIELESARQQLVDAHAAIQNANPMYRQLVRRKVDSVPLSQTSEWLARHEALMLYYSIGYQGALVTSIGRATGPAIQEISIGPGQFQTLRIEPGKPTWDQVTSVKDKDIEAAIQQVLPLLADPQRNAEATERLSVLWEVLVPEADRKAILEGAYKSIVIVPDGAIGMLPFETLVVRAGAEPKYLMDVAPPIVYVPSATLLRDLAERKSTSPDVPPSVLTVGGVAYGAMDVSANARSQSQLQARYGAMGGRLDPLPYTAWEADWVKRALTGHDVSVVELTGTKATEAAFRQNAKGRTILHLACHGLTDQSYGNFFGALALTPGPQSATDPQDDGFLSLAEIYQLDLWGNELAILSACQTNFGPQQQGEGVWALTRGFLVAGSKRVVASNWMVDDAASATLINFFSQHLAKAHQSGDSVSYAQALQKARQAVRNDSRWRKPYYWAPFVLVGPGA